MYIFTLTRRQMARLCAALALGLLLCAALSWGGAQLEAGRAVSGDTLRLHVRASSDTVRDQTLKLIVRDTVLAAADESCPSANKTEALRWAAANLPRLQLAAQSALAQYGAECPVRVRIVNMYFDTAHYSGGALPAGRYDAVRVDLGGGQRYGKNWWCVLYPGLCRAACGAYAAQEENDLVCGQYLVRFRLVEWVQQHNSTRTDEILLAL